MAPHDHGEAVSERGNGGSKQARVRRDLIGWLLLLQGRRPAKRLGGEVEAEERRQARRRRRGMGW